MIFNFAAFTISCDEYYSSHQGQKGKVKTKKNDVFYYLLQSIRDQLIFKLQAFDFLMYINIRFGK